MTLVGESPRDGSGAAAAPSACPGAAIASLRTAARAAAPSPVRAEPILEQLIRRIRQYLGLQPLQGARGVLPPGAGKEGAALLTRIVVPSSGYCASCVGLLAPIGSALVLLYILGRAAQRLSPIFALLAGDHGKGACALAKAHFAPSAARLERSILWWGSRERVMRL